MEMKEKIEQLENENANFMSTLRIIAGDNQRLAGQLRKMNEENEWIVRTVNNHENRIADLEDTFLSWK